MYVLMSERAREGGGAEEEGKQSKAKRSEVSV